MVNYGGTVTKSRAHLIAWAQHEPPGGPVAAPAQVQGVTARFEQFPPEALEDEMNRSGFQDGGRVYSPRVIVMPHIISQPQPLWPVIMPGFFDIGGTLWIGLRVALFRLGDGPLTATGWRFEPPDVLAEGRAETPMTHRYAHAQPISGWRRATAGFLPEEVRRPGGQNDEDAADPIDEHRPAFPLWPPTPEGLIACAIVSLYGTLQAEQILTAATGYGVDVAQLVRPNIGTRRGG